MTLLLTIVVVLALLIALVVLAVGRSAGRARKRDGSRSKDLLALSKFRSESGKPFFPTDDSVLELAELLDDVHERRQRETSL